MPVWYRMTSTVGGYPRLPKAEKKQLLNRLSRDTAAGRNIARLRSFV